MYIIELGVLLGYFIYVNTTGKISTLFDSERLDNTPGRTRQTKTTDTIIDDIR